MRWNSFVITRFIHYFSIKYLKYNTIFQLHNFTFLGNCCTGFEIYIRSPLMLGHSSQFRRRKLILQTLGHYIVTSIMLIISFVMSLLLGTDLNSLETFFVWLYNRTNEKPNKLYTGRYRFLISVILTLRTKASNCIIIKFMSAEPRIN